MAEPLPVSDPSGEAILTVEGLHTFIRTDGGIVRAVDDVSFDAAPRRDTRARR